MPIRHLIFTFHMPLFFLVSGYLYRKKDIKESIKKDLLHLGIPYVITCLAIVLYFVAYFLITESHNAEPLKRYLFASIWGSGTLHVCKYLSDLPDIGALWFLPALFVCKNVYNILPDRKRLLYASFIFLIATIIGRYIIFIPFSVLSGLSAIIFYAIGDLLKGKKRITAPYWALGLLCWFISFRYSHTYLVQPQLDLYFIDVIGATTASILIYLLSKQILKVPVLSKALSWVGESTLIILCFHIIDLNCGISTHLTDKESFTVILRIILPLLGTIGLKQVMKYLHFKHV